MHPSFLTASLSLFCLLFICTLVYLFSKKTHFPYSVSLVVAGLLLVGIQHIPAFSFINHFILTPDVLLYVFLPILLFESAYNINYKLLLKNITSISILSIVGVFLSAVIIGWWLYILLPLVGFQIPFLVCLLFGSLISATDPIAVLATFKSVGAPRRLSIIFEWESLFNDGTAVALFLIILGIILTGEMSTGTYVAGFFTFTSMVIGGILLGIVFGVGFSKMIAKIKNNELVEISLTMILAHVTFLTAELISHYAVIGGFEIKISGIIATTIAGIILWNYGRYAISPKVEAHMNQFWHFFAFLADSLVFILLGLLLSHVNIDFMAFIIPIFVVIAVVMIARAVSVYLPIGVMNFFKWEEYIPKNWQHMLSWWSLRGALAVMMVLLIPSEWMAGYENMLAFQEMVGWNFGFSVKDFLTVITIGSIMFTLFIKATTIKSLMNYWKINQLNPAEIFTNHEGNILANHKILQKLETLNEKQYLTSQEYQTLQSKYQDMLEHAQKSMKTFLKESGNNGEKIVKKSLALHALGIEKQYLKNLFTYNEIPRDSFVYILKKIERQIERLTEGKTQLKSESEKTQPDICEKCGEFFGKKGTPHFSDQYIRARTQAIITRKVLADLEVLSAVDFGFSHEYFDEIITLYTTFNTQANTQKDEIFEKYPAEISVIEAQLTEKALLKAEENLIEDLYAKEIITPKLYANLWKTWSRLGSI